MKHSFPESVSTRSSLLSRIKNPDDQDSWREFDAIYRPLVCGFAQRKGLSPDEAEDAAQATMVAMVKNIHSFKAARSSFKVWLFGMANWRVMDQFRKRSPVTSTPPPPDPAEETQTDPIERIPDPRSLQPDRAWEQEWETWIEETALEAVKPRVSATNYQIYDLYVRQEWPVEEVMRTLKVSAIRVYAAKSRIQRMLKKECEKLTQDPL